MADIIANKNIASGNPLIKEKIDISVKLERLRAAKAEFLKSHEHLATKINITYPTLIRDKLEQLEKIRTDIETIQNHSSDKFSIVLNEKTFIDKKDAAKFIADILKNNHNSLHSLHGEYNGLKFYVAMNHSVMREEIVLNGKFHSKNFSSSIAGDNINRIVKLVENLPSIADSEQKNIESIQQQIEAAKTELAIPFPQQDEFEKLKLREAEISALLNLDSEKQSDIEQEKERRLNNIFSVEPQTNCEKKFFALVKYAVDHNHGNFSLRSQKIAAKKLLEAGFSKKDILETLFKYSPVISDRDELKNILRSIHINSVTK